MVVQRIFRLLRYRKLIIASILGAGGYNYVHNHPFYPYFQQFKDFTDKFDMKGIELVAAKFLNNVNNKTDRMKNWMDWFLAYEPMQLGYPDEATLSVTHNNFKNSTSVDVYDYQDEILDYLQKIENLEKENKELRRQILVGKSKLHKTRKIEPTLIDLYSDILDDLNDINSEFQMPRIIVVGDQSSGKTSVLEMIAKSRIFPRGSGEMMTRSPVKVTLSQGPYHVAQFKDDEREYDLTKEKDLFTLRKEIEIRMIRSLSKESASVSNDIISLTVRGPGLPRMVLVDLPGIISTVTTDMAPDTRERITRLVKTHMANPNSIIMCIQDGSVDAERSNVTDLVSGIDPQGARTIFVLTKVDLAEKNLFSPERVRKILEGKLFPMKALGYYAVVTGTGNTDDSIDEIKNYEEEYFRTSRFMKNGIFKPNQVSTTNMSLAVSKCFWKMVRESIEAQYDELKAERFNLETEWKNSFPKQRELGRDELFERAKTQILDDLAQINNVSPKQWEDQLLHALWTKISLDIMENIYLKAHILGISNQTTSGSNTNRRHANTSVDIALRKWAETVLPSRSIESGWDTLVTFLRKYFENDSDAQELRLYKPLKDAILSSVVAKHEWNPKAVNALHNLQINSLYDQTIHEKGQWDTAVKFMEGAIQASLATIQTSLEAYEAPSFYQRWFGRGTNSPNTDDSAPARVTTENSRLFPFFREEVTRLLKYNLLQKGSPKRANVNIPTIVEQAKTNLMVRGYEFTAHPSEADVQAFIELATNLYKKTLFEASLQNIKECRKAYYYIDLINNPPSSSPHDRPFPNSGPHGSGLSFVREDVPLASYAPKKLSNINCDDVMLFWRIYAMLQATTKALRQQINGTEFKALTKEIRDTLDDFSDDPATLEKLFAGRQVALAEELKKIRAIQEKLDQFIQKLAKEKI